MPLLTLTVAFITCAAVMPVIRRLSVRFNLVSIPRDDRWSRKAIPILGGGGVFFGFVLAILLTGREAAIAHPGLIMGAILMFGLGLWDDAKELSPTIKLIAQIMIAVLTVFSGYRTGFFDNELLNILMTVIWLVGITNALNLVDNMDGLAAGIAVIAAGFMALFFSLNPEDGALLIIIAALIGGVLGFLVFNFPPAKVFMGDSGSLLIGFTLASLAIARTPQASNVFAVLGVPALLFALPILDTTFVTVTRIMRGQSPARGGQDHTSHRLVAFGLSERQTVLVLYGVAGLSGVAGALLESFDYTLSLVFIPILLVVFSVLAAYLSRMKVVDTRPQPHAIAKLLQQLAYRRRLFEIALDFLLISIAYYLASFTRSGFIMSGTGFEVLVQNLPIVIGSTYLVFFLSGIYQAFWRFIGMRDVLRLVSGVFASAILSSVVIMLVFPRANFSFGVQVLFGIFFFTLAAGTRSSFKLLDEIGHQQAAASTKTNKKVLIYNASELGDLSMRWLESLPDLSLQVVGFIDDDPFMKGRRIHEVEILGVPEALQEILRDNPIDGIILAPGAKNSPGLETLRLQCSHADIWLKELVIRLED